MSQCFFAPSTMGDATDDGNLTSSYHWVPTSYFGARHHTVTKPQVLSYHTHNVDKIGEVADGNAVVPSTRPLGGGGCSHRLVAQVHDGEVMKFPQIPSKEGIIISVFEP